MQIKNLRDIRNAGGFGILLYPKDKDYFKHFILNLKGMNKFEWSLSLKHMDEDYQKWLKIYQLKGVLI